MKKSILKTMVKLLFFSALVLYVNDIIVQNKNKMGDVTYSTDITKEDLVKTTGIEPPEIVTIKDNPNTDVKNNPTDYNGILFLHGFGDFSEKDLRAIKSGVEGFYRMDVIISDPIYHVGEEFFINGTKDLNGKLVLSLNRNGNGNQKHMYLTNYALYDNDEDLNLISGYARFLSGISVVSTYQIKKNLNYHNQTVINIANHELAHNFGLEHCDNQNCLMKGSGVNSSYLCDKCEKKIKRKLW
jgi:archaemetzincin